MKKIISIAFITYASLCGAADWWNMPTICQPNDKKCYAESGAGIDISEYDVQNKCSGKKLACPNAIVLADNPGVPTPFSKTELADDAIISSDFDMNVLDQAGTCYGMRKTKNNGTNARVGEDWRNVYCRGILGSPDESVALGEIMVASADQPTCRSLADEGYIGVLSGGCYGKSGYPAAEYYLECKEGDLLPARIAVLNGARDYRSSTQANPTPSAYPATEDAANKLFEKMIQNAAEQQQKTLEEQ